MKVAQTIYVLKPNSERLKARLLCFHLQILQFGNLCTRICFLSGSPKNSGCPVMRRKTTAIRTKHLLNALNYKPTIAISHLPHTIPVPSTHCNKNSVLEASVKMVNGVCQLLFQRLHPGSNIRFCHYPF